MSATVVILEGQNEQPLLQGLWPNVREAKEEVMENQGHVEPHNAFAVLDDSPCVRRRGVIDPGFSVVTGDPTGTTATEPDVA